MGRMARAGEQNLLQKIQNQRRKTTSDTPQISV
jgi:hypothetical protein